ncbi:MAG: sugar transferase [Bacteroidales bacterium]|jgi:lipopolysaccharide/colanic/teichoic acid biosynthesis glycosyltransferase
MLLKRIFDIIASFLGLLVLFPFLLIAGLLVKFSSKGPVLFRQERAGRHGKPFTIYKFRTMIVDHGGSSISVKGEKRITPVGAILRKLKIDELPELWNILIGDMSFVGPRPDMPDYAARLKGEQKDILSVRPGLTSPASIKYAREEEILSKVYDPQKYFDEVIWPDKTRMNLAYVRERSFLGDVNLIIRTIFGKKG